MRAVRINARRSVNARAGYLDLRMHEASGCTDPRFECPDRGQVRLELPIVLWPGRPGLDFDHHQFAVRAADQAVDRPSEDPAVLQERQRDLEGGRPVVSMTVGAFAPESEVANLLRDTEAAHEGISIGSYPFTKDGRFGANFVVRSEDEAVVQQAIGELSDGLIKAGYEPALGGL